MNEQKGRLAQARKNAGYATAISATTRNNWNYSTYSQHERGQRGITRKAAKKYAEAYNVSAGWLLTGEAGLAGELTGGSDEALMAKVIIGVERAGTQEGAKLTPEAKARIIIQTLCKDGSFEF